jgi:hypothetical protein
VTTLRSYLIGTIVPVAALLSSFGTSVAQVVHCTDGGCEPFALACAEASGITMCLNSRYEESYDLPTSKDEHLCDIAVTIMEKNCEKDNEQPCLVAEDRVLDRCFFVPTTVCVDYEQSIEYFQSYPDACFATCTSLQACNHLE